MLVCLCPSVHMQVWEQQKWSLSGSSHYLAATIMHALTCEVSVSAFVSRYDFAREDQRQMEEDLRSVHPLLYSSSKTSPLDVTYWDWHQSRQRWLTE